MTVNREASGKLEIRSVEGDSTLLLEPLGPLPSGYFSAMFRSAGLEARTRVLAYQPEGLGLTTLFRSMAKEWRGWSGAQAYDSLENELSLLCRHDGLGHVNISVKLAGGSNRSWSLKGTVVVEAGALEELARAAERFEQCLHTAA